MSRPPALRVEDLLISEGSENNWVWRYGTKASKDAVTDYVDLTGWTAEAQIRTAVGNKIWFRATEADYITLGATGEIHFSIPHEVTEDPDWWSSGRTTGVWDLELTDPAGLIKRFVMGEVTISKNVTRDQGVPNG